MKFATFFAFLFLGCSGPTIQDVQKNYHKAVRDGLRRIPSAQQIGGQFGDANHYISYHGAASPETWNTVAFVHDRYQIQMQQQIEVSDNFDRVVKVLGVPRFYLAEIQSVQIVDGAIQTDYAQDVHFGLAEWEKIVHQNGDFSFLLKGPMKQNSPVPDFDVFTQSRVDVKLIVQERSGQLIDF
jgi:hypothetical protein